jgi:excisionase family DNA binding protein
MAAKPGPLFLTPNELAARWRLERSTVHELLSRGELPYYQIGGAIRVKWDDILAYEEAGH